MLLDIYSKEQSYYDEYDSFCYQNCIRQILEYFLVKNASFYINTSLSLILRNQDIYDFNIMYDENARGILPEYGKKLNRYYPKEKNKYEVWAENLKKLRLGMPIIIGVDSYHLDYLPYYKNNHAGHTVILTGYLEDKKRVNIIDWYSPWFYKGNINFNDYIEARDSKNIYDGGVYSGYPIENNWAEIDNYGWNTDAIELIKSNINLSINQYYCDYKNEQGSLNGIYALNKIVNMIEEIKVIDSEDKKTVLKNIYHNLYGVAKRKVLFKHFLIISYEETKFRIFKETQNVILRIIDKWEALLNILMKGIFRCKDETLDKVCKSLIEIIKEEDILYDHLIKINDILG